MATIRWRNSIQDTLTTNWRSLRDAIIAPGAGVQPPDERVAELATGAAPVIWLLGKVQSGKTSIVHALTGASGAEIGQGYKPCTQTAAIFDFPTEAPVIRFLDTRGVGEVGYDPAEDIAVHEKQAHLILAVMKALDPQQDPILSAIKAARKRHPGWPVVVAQTTLHEGYRPGKNHPSEYPYDIGSRASTDPSIPHDIARSLAYQRSLFTDVPGNGPVLFVPLDFTRPDDGFEPKDFGLGALIAALEKAAPAGLMAALKDAHAKAGDKLANEAHRHVVGYATAAAAADVVPAAGAVAVPVVQSKMLHSLGRIYGVDWNRDSLAEFAACLSVGVVSRLAAGFGLRQIAKFIPVYGQTAGAAAAAATSFATTFAIGKAACYYLGARKVGASDPAGVAAAYSAALNEAFHIFQQRKLRQGAAS